MGASEGKGAMLVSVLRETDARQDLMCRGFIGVTISEGNSGKSMRRLGKLSDS